MSIDADYGSRIHLLMDLMVQDPNKPVRKLQWEALKYFPIASKEGIRKWMLLATAFRASDMLNQKQENEACS